MEGQAVSAVVAGEAARRNVNARQSSGAPGVVGGADAGVGGAVVVVGALGGNVVARLGSGAPGGSWQVGQAVSAGVVGGATRGDLDASVELVAPGVTSGADALSGLTVVIFGKRALFGDVVAGVGQSAQASSWQVSQTVSAAVVGGATRRNVDAALLGGAPGVTGNAEAFAGDAAVVEGTSGGNVVALVSGGAPGGSWEER